MIDETHDQGLRSWVPDSAGGDFPVQNLPFGCFTRPGARSPRIGVAIGRQVLDLPATVEAGLLDDPTGLLREPTLNRLMGAGRPGGLRMALSHLLRDTGPAAEACRARADALLVPLDHVTMQMPAVIGDFTDFFASIQHATNAGSLFRPDHPLLPNYKYVPVAYHGRASSIIPSGHAVRRPNGQIMGAQTATPVFGPSRMLDYEAELGLFMGQANALGHPVPVATAAEHVFGAVLLNDWSARDIQAWEYQPLGPFLAKSFATTISPWVVTMEALAPFRVAPASRPDGDPAPLPHLYDPVDQRQGGLDIAIETTLESAAMRRAGLPPQRLGRAPFRSIYWTAAQMVAHHTSGGCNLRPGDLLGSGTVSGPSADELGSLLEITRRGARPLDLPGGEHRSFLEDGDAITMQARCERAGYASIGFGTCRGTIEAAPPVA